MILLSAFAIFGVVFKGYVADSYAQSFNLNAINEYHKSSDKSVLRLEKTPPTEYGYNVNLWNDMPLFMKQCYKIDEKTKIEYYK